MKRSKFSLSYTHLFSCDMGELIPCGLTEVLPGDSLMMNTTALVRCAPMLTPPMHPVRVRIHHWFIPMRLLWTSWENFITGGPDGDSPVELPTLEYNGNTERGILGQKFGLPMQPGGLTTPHEIVAWPFMAYEEIYNENYRDQDF